MLLFLLRSSRKFQEQRWKLTDTGTPCIFHLYVFTTVLNTTLEKTFSEITEDTLEEEKAGSKACWDDSHMAIPDWECLLETSIISCFPRHIGQSGERSHMDIGRGVGACACREGKQFLKGHISHRVALLWYPTFILPVKQTYCELSWVQ